MSTLREKDEIVKTILFCLIFLWGCGPSDPVSAIYLHNRILKSEDGCAFKAHVVNFLDWETAWFKPEKSDPNCPLLKIIDGSSEVE